MLTFFLVRWLVWSLCDKAEINGTGGRWLKQIYDLFRLRWFRAKEAGVLNSADFRILITIALSQEKEQNQRLIKNLMSKPTHGVMYLLDECICYLNGINVILC